jgi:CrcB protein
VLALLVALAAGVGAVLRSLVDHQVRRPGFPVGTLVVNVSGAFLLGLLAGTTSGDVAAVLGVGLCGGYTTLSTLTWESLALVEQRARLLAVVNVLGSVALGLLAAWAGLSLS